LAGAAEVFARDVATVYARSNDCVALASEHGFAQWAASGRILHGWADAQQGETTTGVARIRDGLAAVEATGNRVLHRYSSPCWPRHWRLPGE
jgi:predicted ATPase